MPRDDDDWVGTPPEGRISRDRANPEFWRHQHILTPAAVGIVILLAILVLVIVL